jgi:hypothetical protein
MKSLRERRTVSSDDVRQRDAQPLNALRYRDATTEQKGYFSGA